MSQIHATAISIDGAGVLLRGPSACGKSDLALRLVDQLDGGAQLIADDRVDANTIEGNVQLSAPETLYGMIEVRGLGIVKLETIAEAPLRLIVDLKPYAEIDHMPEPQEDEIEGVSVPVIEIDPFETSAIAKIKIALQILDGKASLLE
ncbi:MAG: HPr kinase/phosphatase C-terminal domain-containing protein [Rhodospirillales bacterium]